jgi:hypothetical protein
MGSDSDFAVAFIGQSPMPPRGATTTKTTTNRKTTLRDSALPLRYTQNDKLKIPLL